MRLFQRCRVNFVVLRDSPMDTIDHRLGFAWQMRDAKRSLPAFDTRPRGIDDITRGYLLPGKSVRSKSEFRLMSRGNPQFNLTGTGWADSESPCHWPDILALP